MLVQLTSIIDGVDGEIARLTGKASRFGAFLDSILDRFVDAAVIVSTSIYLLQILFPPQALVLCGAILFSSLMVSFMHARSEASLGVKLQLIDKHIYAGRDVRLFILSTALISVLFNALLFLGLMLMLLSLQLTYIFHKLVRVYKLRIGFNN